MIPEILIQEIEFLRKEGFRIKITEDGKLIKLIINSFPLPDGYSIKTSDILLIFTYSYPVGKPDMFWLEQDVLLANGQVPNAAEVIEKHLGRSWRRVSWHSGKWNPGRDDLNTFISFIETGLLKARNK